MKLKTVLAVSLVCCSAFAPVQAQKMTTDDRAKITEPVGGQPAPGAKPSVADLNYQVTYHRAFEAVIWSIPAVAVYGFYSQGHRRQGQHDPCLVSAREAER